MNNIDNSSLKRFSDSNNTENNSNKKAKNEYKDKEVIVNQCFTDLIKNQYILDNIFDRLPFSNNLAFEQVSKNCQKAIKHRWKKYSFSFNWLNCSTKEKGDYLLNIALVKYIHLIRKWNSIEKKPFPNQPLFNINKNRASIIHKNFKILANDFPDFYHLIGKHLHHFNNTISFHKKNFQLILKSKNNFLSGEKFLNLLIKISDKTAKDFPLEELTQTITDNCTITILFAVQLFGSHPTLQQHLEDLTFQAAAKGDYRSFNALLSFKTKEQLDEMRIRLKVKLDNNPYCLGLLLAHYAYWMNSSSINFSLDNSRYDLALEAFKKASKGTSLKCQFPVDILNVNIVLDIVRLKKQIGKWEEAETLCTQLLFYHDLSLPSSLSVEKKREILIETISLKIHFNKWEEAEDLRVLLLKYK